MYHFTIKFQYKNLIYYNFIMNAILWMATRLTIYSSVDAHAIKITIVSSKYLKRI